MFSKMKRPVMVISALCLSTLAFAQGGGSAQGLTQLVNPFTGDFSYGVPLISVSGPNGESFPIGMNYNAGIQMNQEASWVGLGWTLAPGEILRTVKGVPDDWNGKTMRSTEWKGSGSVEDTDVTTTWFGPMYFHNMLPPAGNLEQQMDIYQSDHDPNDGIGAFSFPDYDAFQVSGPGIAGEMQMHLFEYANLYSAPIHSGDDHYYFYDNEATGAEPFTPFSGTKRPHFRFKNEQAAKISAPYYGDTGYDETCNCYAGGGAISWLSLNDGVHNGELYRPDQIGTHVYNGDYNAAKNRMHSATYVEYFTNAEIVAHYDHVVNNNMAATKINGFMDFVETDGTQVAYDYRANGNYDPDGIGAFRITSPEGLVYHYSLPAYNSNESSVSFSLLDNFNLSVGAKIHEKTSNYAYSWKLTAVTGMDFDDDNDNGIVDEGDVGYWIALDYTHWIDGFEWRSPYFGFFYDQVAKRHPDPYRAINDDEEVYSASGSCSSGSSDLYYLNTVKTSSQTMYFVKDYRKDAHSAPGVNGDIPKLYLKNLILLDNDDIETTWFDATTKLPTTDFAQIANLNNTINATQYAEDATAINAVSLQTIDFEYDYSLAPGLYNNIDNEFTTSAVEFHATGDLIYHDKTGTVSDDQGKLTLLGVKSYEFAHGQDFPGYDFEYKAGLATGEPYKFDHEQKDFFGYYKHGFQTASKGGYITSLDSKHVDAWSLLKIKTPLGAEIDIEYESDDYQGVGYDLPKGYPTAVSRTFRVTSVTNTGGLGETPNLYFFDQDAVQLFNDPEVATRSMWAKVTDGTTYGIIAANEDLEGVTGSNYIAVTDGLNASAAVNNYALSPAYTAWVELTMNKAFGGGVRVKKISTTDLNTDESYSVELEYNTGIATAEMDRFGPMKLGHVLTKNAYGGDRHALRPGVGYSNVSVKIVGDNGHSLGSTEYDFINYRDSYKPMHLKAVAGVNEINQHEVILIHEDNSLYGRHFAISKYDENDNKVNYTEYKYGPDYNERANVEEVFYRVMRKPSSNGVLEYTTHTVYYKRTLQNYLKERIIWQDGLRTVVRNEVRDGLTGATTKVVVENPAEEPITTITTPLFRNTTDYGVLGPKYLDENNLNLLAPTETSKMYRSNVLVGGSHAVWAARHPHRYLVNSTPYRFDIQSQVSAWAPVKAYSYNGEIDESLWKVAGELTLVGGTNLLYEQRDNDDFYSASKFGYDQRYKIAEIVNSNFASFTHCTFESTVTEVATTFFDGEVGPLNPYLIKVFSTQSVTAHSGRYLAKVPSGVTASVYRARIKNVSGQERGLMVGRTYRASVWVHSSSPSNAKLRVDLDGTSTDGTFVASAEVDRASATITAGEWTLLTFDILVPSDYVTNAGEDLEISLTSGTGGDAYFDDLRIHPVDAQVTAYTRDVTRGLVLYALNVDNFYTRYEYDSAGRVLRTYIETTDGEVKVTETEYGFSGDSNP
jgi:hypothetical protein